MSMNNLVFLAAAVVIIAVGAIAEHRITDETWQRKKAFRQQVNTCYQRMIIRHRSHYVEIGYTPK